MSHVIYPLSMFTFKFSDRSCVSARLCSDSGSGRLKTVSTQIIVAQVRFLSLMILFSESKSFMERKNLFVNPFIIKKCLVTYKIHIISDTRTVLIENDLLISFKDFSSGHYTILTYEFDALAYQLFRPHQLLARISQQESCFHVI